jgi:hypothetical protein
LKKLGNCLLFGLALLGALITIDLYLQIAEIQGPMETRIDPKLGPTWIPNKHIIRFGEGFFLGAANEFGYMGPAVPPRRVGNEKRILLLGDSFVLGHTVLPRHYFIDTGHPVSNLWPQVELSGDSLVVNYSFRLNKTYRFYKMVEPIFEHSAVLRLVFNTYKMISKNREGNRWIDVVFGKFAPAFNSGGDDAAVAPKEPRELSALSRAILRELSKDPRNTLVLKGVVAPSLLAEIRAYGMPIFWPITKIRGHWNHAAHELIGRFLSDQIVTRKMLWH